MAREIERKFLVTGAGWRQAASGLREISQFYLARTDRATVRVRILDGARARMTVKGNAAGASRAEYEWDIPLADARAMEAMRSGRTIRKTRHMVGAGELTWEIDEFEDGLVLAEIELPSEAARFDRPGWIGREVTGDPRYYNAAMALGCGASATGSSRPARERSQ